MKVKLAKIALLFAFVVLSGNCSSPLNQFAEKQVKKQANEVTDSKLASMGKIALSKKNFAFYNMDGRVYKIEEVQDMPLSLREEIYRRELIRRAFIRRGLDENIFKDAEAEAYIWPRMEKVLEEYYHHKKANYPAILAQNKLRFSANQAIEKFYDKNKEAFNKEKLSMDDIKLQIAKKIQILTEKEYEEKKLAAIKELLKTEKIEIPR